MGEITNIARSILEHRAPYLGVLIALKILALAAVFFGQGSGLGTGVAVMICAITTAADVALRVAASRQHSLSMSKHGTDVLLIVLLLADVVACSSPAGGESKACHALRLVVPFVVLTSVGGNFMRLTSVPRTAEVSTGARDEEQG